MDFDIYNIPGSILRQAKDIIAAKDSPFKEWSAALRKCSGILDYSRAAIFALIRSAHPSYYLSPGRLSGYINANLVESDHQNPTDETLAAARQVNSAAVVAAVVQGKEPLENLEKLSTDFATVGALAAKAAKQETSELIKQPEVANLGNGIFSVDGLMNPPAKLTEEATSDVQMEETDNNEIKANPEMSQSETAVLPVKSADATGDASASLNNEPVHHINTDPLNAFYTHLMVDMETMGNSPDAPIVSIGAVFFDPSTGNTGAEFYRVVSLESSMSFGMKPDASTIQWWLKQSSEARSAILVDEAMGLRESLELLADFIAENAANGSHTVQLWGNGCSFDNVILRRAHALTETPFAVPFRNDRDVRTMVELGKSVGINPRYDIPFEGDMHNALSDARHQVKYVSAIWQRLTAN